MRTLLFSFLFALLASGFLAQAEEPKARQDAPQTFLYKSIGTYKLSLDVFRPPDTQLRPVIFWIHGGALISGERRWLPPQQRQRYVAARFVVVSIDYRLAPETKLEGILEDLKDAHAWVVKNGEKLFSADASRLAVVGNSAGGYLTLMSGFVLQPRPKALVSFYGYGDIAGPWYSKPDEFYRTKPLVTEQDALASLQKGWRGRFYLYCRQNGLWPKEVSGYDPEKEPAKFERYCPERNVDAAYPPTLLLHGDQDTDVPVSLSRSMDAALTRQKVEHELIIMKGMGHSFDTGPRGLEQPEVKAVFNHALEFLTSKLKP